MNWGNEGYGVGIGMPIMGVMLDSMNVPPINPPLSVPQPLIGPMVPEDMNIESEDLNNEADSQNQEYQANDVSSTQSQKRQSRDYSSYGRRDYRDKDTKNTSDRGRHRSRSREHYEKYNRFNDRNNRNKNGRIRNHEHKFKWNNDKMMPPMVPHGQAIPNINPGTLNMGLMPGMIQFPSSNMMNSNMIMNNMLTSQNIEGQHMMIPNMNMMGNMIPNMMEQNMLMINQPLMPPLIPNQPIYMNSGMLLPPTQGTAIPKRHERPKGCRTIIVGGLPSNITVDALSEMFQRFGNIECIKSLKNGIHYVRFERQECLENAFYLSGYRFKYHDQMENDATTILIDYTPNCDDQTEYDKFQSDREPTPPRIEPFTSANLASLSDKIKSETAFAEAAPTLAGWIERGECNKKFANQFYSLIQASNNQIRRLFNEKMQLDEDLQNMKTSIKDKFAHIVTQFEQVAKILSAAKHQRASDHFTKQQRRNIDMWLKMTEEVENIKEEFSAIFEDEDSERSNKNSVSLEKYEDLKKENENLAYKLEGYKNEACLAKDEAERKFEKFKAHFIAQQALQNKSMFPPLPQSNTESPIKPANVKAMPAPPTPDDEKVLISGQTIPPTEAKLISILTSFLMVHPLGASLDYLVSYIRSMIPNVTQATVLSILKKYTEIFHCKTTGVGACIEHKWNFVTFDIIKNGR